MEREESRGAGGWKEECGGSGEGVRSGAGCVCGGNRQGESKQTWSKEDMMATETVGEASENGEHGKGREGGEYSGEGSGRGRGERERERERETFQML